MGDFARDHIASERQLAAELFTWIQPRVISSQVPEKFLSARRNMQQRMLSLITQDIHLSYADQLQRLAGLYLQREDLAHYALCYGEVVSQLKVWNNPSELPDWRMYDQQNDERRGPAQKFLTTCATMRAYETGKHPYAFVEPTSSSLLRRGKQLIGIEPNLHDYRAVADSVERQFSHDKYQREFEQYVRYNSL